MKPVLVLVLVLVPVPACHRAAPSPAPRAAAPVAAAAPPPLAPPEAAAPAAPDDLVAEPRDRDPGSETVTIKIVADPRRQARVLWGRKDLGVAPLEITRPRASGPLDLLVLAPGYLPLHTRVFTDRDDKIALRLYGESEGPTLLGYREPQ